MLISAKELRANKLPFICVALILIFSYCFTALAGIDDYWLKRFNYVMFLPAPIAAIFLYLENRSYSSLIKPIFTKINPKAISFSVAYPLVVILSCAVLAQLVGLATVNWSELPNAIEVHSPIQLLWALGFLLGEEYAWRGYLLPSLSKSLGIVRAAWIVGIVWAIWHGPLVFLLATKLKTSDSPLTLTIVQMFVVMIFSFPFAYAYRISGSIIPPMIMHYVWNWFNPEILGNIYRNQPGLAKGNIFVINGEGVLGAFLGLFFVAWFIKNQLKEKGGGKV